MNIVYSTATVNNNLRIARVAAAGRMAGERARYRAVLAEVDVCECRQEWTYCQPCEDRMTAAAERYNRALGRRF